MVNDASVSRGDVFLVALNPTRGQEIQKTRPCVVVSPDELNAHMGTFIVAPLTSGCHRYPFRIPCSFDGRDGHVVPDQLRTVDRERLVKHLGVLPEGTLLQLLGVLQEAFDPQSVTKGPGIRRILCVIRLGGRRAGHFSAPR